MPNPGLSEAEIAQTIGAVERALREGYPPPGRARRGARSAIMRASELLSVIERKPVPEPTLRSRLRAIKLRSLRVWCSLSNPLATKSSTSPAPISTSATMTTPLERRSRRRLARAVDVGSCFI